MPRMNLASWIIWVAIIVAQPAVTALVMRHGPWRPRTSLLSFLAFRSLLSFCLLAIKLSWLDPDPKGAAYFYTFWAGAIVSSLLGIWVIAEISCELFGISPTVRAWTRALAFLLALTGFGLLIVTLNPPDIPFGEQVTCFSIHISRAAHTASLGTFLLMALLSDILGLRYRRHLLGISIGFAVESCAETSLTWLLGIFPAPMLSDARGALYLLALLIWIGTMLTKETVIDPSRLDIERLRFITTTFLNVTQRIRK